MHSDKLTLEKFEFFEVQNSDYSVGYRRVLTRLFGKKPALAIVTKPTSGQSKRLFSVPTPQETFTLTWSFCRNLLAHLL